jgi:hypothetical protein
MIIALDLKILLTNIRSCDDRYHEIGKFLIVEEMTGYSITCHTSDRKITFLSDIVTGK